MQKQSKLRQHLPFLCACFKSNKTQQKDMITHANIGQMEAIGEVALNLLKGNIIVPTSSFKRLKSHKLKLLYLACKKTSLKKKEEVLHQKGGFLPALAALVAPLAVDLLGKVFIPEHLLQSLETERRLTPPAQLPTLTRLD